MRSRSIVLLSLLALAVPASIAAADVSRGWLPRVASPTPAAKRILDSLPDPRRVPIPDEIRRASAAGGSTIPTPAPPRPADTIPRETSGICLEVQLAATGDEARAAAWARDAAAALVTETRLVPGGGLYRVRAGGCLDRADADALAARARTAGWTGAFVTPGR